jgi:hypothetical protein
MSKKSSSAPVKKPAVKKVARKKAVKKAVRKTTAKKAIKTTAGKTAKTTARKTAKKVAARKTVAKRPPVAKPERAKRPRAKVINDHPDNIVVDANDHKAVEALDRAKTARARKPRVRRYSAVDEATNPPPGEPGAGSMVARVSEAIERELSKIERIVGNPTRMLPAQRVETESRARVLASLARTLKEVMRLREQERAGDDTRAADDDAVPRDLDEFRRELSRRLEGMVAVRAPLPAGGHEPG